MLRKPTSQHLDLGTGLRRMSHAAKTPRGSVNPTPGQASSRCASKEASTSPKHAAHSNGSVTSVTTVDIGQAEMDPVQRSTSRERCRVRGESARNRSSREGDGCEGGIYYGATLAKSWHPGSPDRKRRGVRSEEANRPTPGL